MQALTMLDVRPLFVDASAASRATRPAAGRDEAVLWHQWADVAV